jgi:hypothetical protein
MCRVGMTGERAAVKARERQYGTGPSRNHSTRRCSGAPPWESRPPAPGSAYTAEGMTAALEREERAAAAQQQVLGPLAPPPAAEPPAQLPPPPAVPDNKGAAARLRAIMTAGTKRKAEEEPEGAGGEAAAGDTLEANGAGHVANGAHVPESEMEAAPAAAQEGAAGEGQEAQLSAAEGHADKRLKGAEGQAVRREAQGGEGGEEAGHDHAAPNGQVRVSCSHPLSPAWAPGSALPRLLSFVRSSYKPPASPS